MNMGALNYDSTASPDGYQCSKCQAKGIKLWRQYQTFSDHIDLLCSDCALEDQKKSFVVGEEGTHMSEHGESDQIGSLVPAIPTEEGDTFWGYTSTPTRGCTWWFLLPLREGQAGPGLETLRKRLQLVSRFTDSMHEHSKHLADRLRARLDEVSALEARQG